LKLSLSPHPLQETPRYFSSYTISLPFLSVSSLQLLAFGTNEVGFKLIQVVRGCGAHLVASASRL
jgi:hypothetical protein